MKKFKPNASLLAGCILVGLMLLMVLWGWIATPYDPNAMDADLKFAGPSLSHLMGCDNFGRDVFSRILQGVGNTFIVSVGTVAIGVVFGILIGGLCGYYGGWLDEALMRCNDVLFAFPSVFLALVVISLIGPGKYQVIVALGIAFIPSFARMVRSEFMKQRNRDYCLSAQLMGASSLRTMFVHILPNALPVILSSVIIGFNNAVIAEAGLSYLGIGVQPPEASLGAMLSDSQSFLYKDPMLCIFPGVVMALMILGFALLAEGLTEKKK
ncbi:MAG: ABC transporter permease [Lachnospiraceae bacterium]|nr:ABC transporter permease [Lachnospiraceae bacterium]